MQLEPLAASNYQINARVELLVQTIDNSLHGRRMRSSAEIGARGGVTEETVVFAAVKV